MAAMRAGSGVRRKGWDAWLDMWQSGPIGEDGRRKIKDIRMKTPQAMREFFWRCLGLQTPAGRVMVGEKRTCFAVSNSPMEIVRVVDGERVTVRFSDGAESDYQAKKIAATWNLLGETAHRDRRIS